MKRNILISFASYFVISIICLITGGLLYDYMYHYYGPHNGFWLSVSIAHYFAVLSLYFLAGWHFLKPTSNKKKEFLSIWLLSIVWVIISIAIILFVNFDSNIGSKLMLTNPLLTCYFCINFFFDIVPGGLNSVELNISSLLCSIVPSLFLWLGMLSKKNRATIKQGRQESKELE